jgi:hypothetical protein
MFRPGSTKSDVWDALKTGKVVEIAKLHAICDAVEKSRAIVHHTLEDAERKGGYKVVRNKEAKTVQVIAPKK